MDFTQGFLLVSSMLFIAYMAVYAYKQRERNGSIAFFLLMIFALVWSFASFMELVVLKESSILLWRNIQQIGVFGTPLISLVFAIQYSANFKLKKYINLVIIVQIISVLLIFTDSLHHLMRNSITFVESEVFGKTLVIQSTALGTVLVSINFMLSIIAIIILIDYLRKIDKTMKKQVLYIIISFLLVFVAAFLKMAILNDLKIFISISILYIPGALLMFFTLFKYNLLSFNPIGRDQIFEYINQGIIITNKDKIITDINKVAKNWIELYYQKKVNLIGKNLPDFFQDIIIDFQLDTELEERTFEVQFEGRVPEYLRIHRTPFLTEQNKILGIVIILTDITQIKLNEAKLEYLATHDRLTDTLNRIAFENLYESLLSEKKLISLITLDIDNFKRINDKFGHVFGDKILISLANTIKEHLPEKSYIGRLGGEEFGIIILDKSKTFTKKISEEIRLAVTKLSNKYNQEEIRFTVSLGISDNEKTIKLFEYIRNEADMALYQAKQTGKNKTIIYQQENKKMGE